MDIKKTLEDGTLTVQVIDRLNTSTAPQLEKELADSLDDAQILVLDLGELNYISSAGLRVILSTQKAMSRKGGSLIVRNVKPEIYDVFEMTGFVDFLTIE